MKKYNNFLHYKLQINNLYMRLKKKLKQYYNNLFRDL